MKNRFINIQKFLVAIGMGIFLFSGCSTEDLHEWETTVFEPGAIDASVSGTSIMAGESVTYTSTGAKVNSYLWIFPGGSPESSTDAEVVVTYPKGGEYTASLEVKYVDNTSEKITLPVVLVEGLPQATYQPIFTKSFALYTEYDKVEPGVDVTMEINNQFTIADEVISPYEGSTAKSFKIDGSSDWAMASIKPVGGPVDISQFADGYYNISLKSTSTGTILIRLQGGGRGILTFTAAGEEYGFKRDGEWHVLEIPIADFVAADPGLDLTAITDLLVFRSEGDVRTANNYDFYMDNFFLSSGNVKQTFTESLGFYTENENVTMVSDPVSMAINNQFTIEDEVINPYEGSLAKAFKIDGSSDWAMASIKPANTLDISAFADGYYNVALRSTSTGTILIRLQGGGRGIITFTAAGEEYGFKRDGEWHWVKIPLADFVAADPGLDLSAITDLLVFRSEGDVRTANNYDFYMDHFFLSK